MANIIDIPCDILVIETGYTSRLLDKLDILYDFCINNGVAPMFIHDYMLYALTIKDGEIVASEDENYENLCMNTINTLHNNGLQGHGSIAFKVDSYYQAAKIIDTISDLEYCEIYGNPKVMFLGVNGVINIVYVKIAAESG